MSKRSQHAPAPPVSTMEEWQDLSEVERIRLARIAREAERQAREAEFEPEEIEEPVKEVKLAVLQDPNSEAWHLVREVIETNADVDRVAKRLLPLAFGTMASIMEDFETSPSVKMKTAQYIIDRVVGRPTVVADVSVTGERQKRIVISKAMKPPGDHGVIDAEFVSNG